MTSAQVVETSVNVISNSPSQDYTHPDDRTLLYQVDVVGKLKVKSRNTYIYIYIHHQWPTLNKIILHGYLTLCPFTLVSRLLSSPPMVAMVLQRLTAKRVHRKY